VRRVVTRAGAELPVLGQGTWGMGVHAMERSREVAALQLGFDLGMTLLDTAELYASGGAEEVAGEALRGRREAVFLVTKVMPENASREGTIAAAERSLRRLQTDWIDLYLLHWEGRHPIAETLEGFETLRQQGKIRHYGVSNFDLDWMHKVEETKHGESVCANQVFYNLRRRGIERNLLPWCAERRIAIMAYTPLDQGRLRQSAELRRVAARHEATPEQIALAWTLRSPGVMTLVKAVRPEHVRQNAAAAGICLTPEDCSELDQAFPRPSRNVPLDVI